MNVQQQIDAGRALIASLPNVIDSALIGSAMYLPNPADIDFLVLIEDNAMNRAKDMEGDGWGKCGEYDSEEGVWCAIRRKEVNLILTHDPGRFARFKTSMEVCKALHLEHKEDRIAVCQIVRDGKTADDVMTHAQIKATVDKLFG